MMIVWILLALVVLAIVVFALLYVNALRASGIRDLELDAMIQPALDAIGRNDPNAAAQVSQLAGVPAVRNHLYTKLLEIGQEGLFPESARSAEKMAESDLARWLMHPNELKTAPEAIALVREVPVSQDGQNGRMFLFRFRTEPSHWASENGWMAGVAGPYWDDQGSPDYAAGTFSELTPFDSMTEEEHIAFLRESLKRRGLVVRC